MAERAKAGASARRAKLLVRDALVLAAEKIGRDGAGADGLIGYFVRAERLDPSGFLQALVRAHVAPLSATTVAVGVGIGVSGEAALAARVAAFRARIEGIAARLAEAPEPPEPEPARALPSPNINGSGHA